ncbi:MAG: VWA domain-containing protein [Desulfobacterales bacterium]|jgi:fructose-specific component phosphotransferase system IIB-like protein
MNSTIYTQNSMETLSIADPELAERVSHILMQKGDLITKQAIELLVNETLWGLSVEYSFGQAIAGGYADLIGETSSDRLKTYAVLVREAGGHGPTVGRMIATYLVPVLKLGNNHLLDGFIHVSKLMRAKGSYTLKEPLKGLGSLLINGDVESAAKFLELLMETFSKELTYSRCQYFASVLPKMVLDFDPSRRIWQTEQMRRIIREDQHLADSFLNGMEKGLNLLSQDALENFIDRGLKKYRRNRRAGIMFFALESRTGMNTCQELQVTVPLCQVRRQLDRYLQARIGNALTARALSSLPKSFTETLPHSSAVCSDGTFIYLPDEIRNFPTKYENVKLYKILARLEAAFYEFGSFDFNHENFFTQFPNEALAVDLFTIFELARIRILLLQHYPGLVRRCYPLLRSEALRLLHEKSMEESVFWLYAFLALDLPITKAVKPNANGIEMFQAVAELFIDEMDDKPSVDFSAELVLKTFPIVSEMAASLSDDLTAATGNGYRPLIPAFNWRPWPHLYFSAHPQYDRLAQKLMIELATRGLSVSKSELKKRLVERSGFINSEDIVDLADQNEFGDLDIEKILESWLPKSQDPYRSRAPIGPVFWYKEWDNKVADYLHDHVRVSERTLPTAKNNFYQQVLSRHYPLIRRMRSGFELLKPEALSILRQWVEGDEFDYRALLDFALDKKAGLMPSDRIYIKRVKNQRDVAVLLLVDLSHSTSNLTLESQASVLDVEKEAIVIFSEALEVVGDTFAIAGFSGTGRLGVDYCWLKNFDEITNDTVRYRIDALAPQRNTRMGAAIRHAATQLEKQPAKVRLLIILGDGFPNDVDYKKRYAIADTQQALLEAQSKNVYVHAITVNIAADPQLDELYGTIRHSVITDVRELPDRLPWIYGALTKG